MIAAIDQLLTAAYLAIGWQPHTWAAIFVWLNLADAGISAHALRLGGREINPVMRAAMAEVGTVPALALSKAAIIAGVFVHLGTVILYLPALVLLYAAACAWGLHRVRQLRRVGVT